MPETRASVFAYLLRAPFALLTAALALKRRLRPPREGAIGRLLVIRSDRLGDVVLSLPAIHSIRQRLPRAHVAVLVREDLAGLLELVPGVDEVIGHRPDDGWRETLRLWRALRRGRFDASIDLGYGIGLRMAVAALCAGIPQRFGYAGRRYARLYTDAFALRAPQLRFEGAVAQGIAERALGARARPVPPPRFDALLERTVGDAMKSAGVAPGDRLVAFNLGVSSNNPLRAWDIRGFAEVIDRIGAEPNVRIVVTGSEREQPLLRELLRRLSVPVIPLVGRTSIPELCAWLRACRVCVSNNTGPMQLAVFLGTPTVVINGPSGLIRWAPRDPRHRIVSRWLPCSFVDCNGERCTRAFECIRAITPDEVCAAVRELLDGTGRSP